MRRQVQGFGDMADHRQAMRPDPRSLGDNGQVDMADMAAGGRDTRAGMAQEHAESASFQRGSLGGKC